MTTLEKIRAEIEQTTDDYNPAKDVFDGGYVMAIRDVLQIIDKYAEQETDIEYIGEFCHKHGLVLMSKEMADKYAEQEPCDDAISREWLKTAIHNFYYGLKHTPTEEDIQAYIDVAPSVRPQEQTGKWEEIVEEHKCYARDDTYTTTEYHCSECGAEPFVNEDGFYELSNYCPYCGAKMESEDKE